MLERHTYHHSGEFKFEAGGTLPAIDICYHCSPRPYTEGEKVIWICHALTANSDPEDWWPGMVGPGKAIDPDRHYVVCVNMLASPYGSSSPASINPATGEPFYLDFPEVTIRDIVAALTIIRKALGIKTVDVLIGSSIGGFQAIEWAVTEPDVIQKALFMATAPRVPAFLTAYNESQRMAIEADPTFREAASLKGGTKGLEAARAIALISYRSYEGYDLTQTDADPDTLFAQRACSYERYQGTKLSRRFDAYCYWYLTYSLDSHNVGRRREGVEAALGTIKADVAVICIDSDAIFPPKMMHAAAEAIPGASWHLISSAFGHDGFLLENEQITKILKDRFDI